MKSLFNTNRSGLVAGAAASLALAAMGFAGAAQARDNVSFSLGIGVPGVQVGVTNAYPVYAQPAPVYYQPAPVYVQPAPVYYQPRPYFYEQPQVVYVQPGYRNGWYRNHGEGHEGHERREGGYREHGRHDDDRGFRQGYAPIYYRR